MGGLCSDVGRLDLVLNILAPLAKSVGDHPIAQAPPRIKICLGRETVNAVLDVEAEATRLGTACMYPSANS